MPYFYVTLLITFVISTGVFLFLYLKTRKSLYERSQISQAIWKIDQIILNTLDFSKVVHSIVNAALIELSKYGYAILVLSLVDESEGVLKRIAISSTDEAKEALQYSPIPFNSIEIPISAKNNLAVRVMYEKKPLITNHISDLLLPVIEPLLADKAQEASGIKASIVYPISVKGKILGSLIASGKKNAGDITWYEKEIMTGFVDAVGIAIENSSLFQELEQTSKKLAQANAKLKVLDKLKDDFVSIASHELRTPMTAIKSYLWMALKRPDVPLSEKMTRYISRSYISTERLINLVNDMLNVSRIESGRIEISPQTFDIMALVSEVMTEVGAKASEKGINLHTLNNQPPRVFADPDKVHQVLLNLIGNSLKFTPSQGSITVSFFTDGRMVEVSVKDTGTGIAKDDMSRLFQKFERLDSSYVSAATSGGTGLGLYISKSLVELMGGKIKAQSDGVGKGTTFTFSLPVANKEVLAQAEKYTKKPIGDAKTLEPVAI